MITPRKIDDRILLQKHAVGATGKELAAYFGCSPAAISKRLKRLTPGPPTAIDALTPKQAAVVRCMAKTGKSATAAVEEYYDTGSRASAREIASRLTAIPQVQLALAEEMDRAGLTRSYRVSKLADACEHPDPGIALKSLDMAFRLADDFPAIKSKAMVVHTECSPVDLSAYMS